MFREDYVNIEVRIASYLQVMKCPTLSTVRKIFHALRHEPVNQGRILVLESIRDGANCTLSRGGELSKLVVGGLNPARGNIWFTSRFEVKPRNTN